MTNFTLIQQRQQLERVYQQSQTLYSGQTRLRKMLLGFLHKLVMALTMPKEPRIWTTLTSQGQVQYHAYDPVDGQRFVGDSETALRAWLEQRYYC
ncbi:MAG: hypothetical protein F6J87_10160 [Spirulina sp. SIO3F2]|nr:hypothetical protein [Spirulina sp. SIO3F2]